MKIAISGHRPEKIPNSDLVIESLVSTFDDLDVSHVITGMAAGVDLMAGNLAYLMDIPFTCAKPWTSHTSRSQDREVYQTLIKNAAVVHIVTPIDTYPGPWVYQKRNEWMVDNAEKVIAVWDGSSGGTSNCVSYAYNKGKNVYVINPITGATEWL